MEGQGAGEPGGRSGSAARRPGGSRGGCPLRPEEGVHDAAEARALPCPTLGEARLPAPAALPPQLPAPARP